MSNEMAQSSAEVRHLNACLAPIGDTWRRKKATKQRETDQWPKIKEEIDCLLGLDFVTANLDDLFACSEALSLALEDSYWYYFPRVISVLERNSEDPRSGNIFERLVFNLENPETGAVLSKQLDSEQRQAVTGALAMVELNLFNERSTAETVEKMFQSVSK